MKKFLISSIIIFMALIVAGCSNETSFKSSGTVICTSEEAGSNPQITYYEEYVVKDNKVEVINIYKRLKFDDNYFKSMSIDDVIEIYESGSYKVEKVSDTELRQVAINPANIFEDLQTDNMIETIVDTLENNDFLLNKYSCEIK